MAALQARRPVLESCPRALGAEQEQKILEAREKTNWGPMRLAYLTGGPGLPSDKSGTKLVYAGK